MTYMRHLVVWCCLAYMAWPSLVGAANGDTDADGLIDDQEIQIYHTDPYASDTDQDGFLDGAEIQKGYSPHAGKGITLSQHDYDQDGMSDWLEILLQTDLGKSDTDGDGFLDGAELKNNYDPRSAAPRKLPKRITVNLEEQRLRYYWDDRLIDSFSISSGLPKTLTPKGTFAITDKLPVVNYRGVGYNFSNTKWNLRFTGIPPKSLYIHGAWWHSNFGNPMSHGCVNVPYSKMEPLYAWADLGTVVYIE